MTSLNRRRKYLPNEERDDISELYRRLDDAHDKIRELNAQIGKRQHFLHWREPYWLNGFQQVDPPLEPFAYRWASSKFPVFKGHIDVQNADSGDVAFLLQGDNDEEGLYLPYDVRDHIVLTDDGGFSFIMGLVIIEASSGNFSIIWPVT